MQAICLDIDGTLLSSKGKILKETKEALLQSQAQGIRLILASGRPTQGVLEFAQELEMDQHHGLCITYNGSQALDVQTHEILFNEARGCGQILGPCYFKLVPDFACTP